MSDDRDSIASISDEEDTFAFRPFGDENENETSPTYFLMLGAILTVGHQNLSQIMAADESFDINEKGVEGYTLLHHAAMNACSLDIVNFLLNNGANVNSTTSERDSFAGGIDSFYLAAANNAPWITNRLLDLGVNPRASTGYGFTSFHFAVSGTPADRRREETTPVTAAKFLLPRYPDLFLAKTKFNTTLLHLTRDVRFARFLIENGDCGKPVPPDFILTKDMYGVTALEKHSCDFNADTTRMKKLCNYLASYSEMPVGVAAPGVETGEPRKKKSKSLNAAASVKFNLKLDRCQHQFALNALILLGQLPVYEVAFQILGYLSVTDLMNLRADKLASPVSEL